MENRFLNEKVEATFRRMIDIPVYRFRNMTMLTDFYQLTMMYGYYKSGTMNERAVFDVFYRVNPFGHGFTIMAGLEQVIWYLHNARFTDEDLEYIRSVGDFDEGFYDCLRKFRFTGSLYAVPEGTVVFPQVPLLRFEGSIFELQLLESAVLCFINHEMLIATKASRIVQAARGLDVYDGVPAVMEFGLRRAQNADAAVFGTRAAYIGGCVATSNVYAGQMFGIPVSGTQSHSWIQSFSSELEAFRVFVQSFPYDTTLLVDTYDVLRSGVPNVIQVATEMRERGQRIKAVRIDSGDLAYLSKETRRMLDEAGFPEIQIVASSDLDEYTIRDMLIQGAKIDAWGVGTNLITARDTPALGGVYKLTAIETEAGLVPRIKLSENSSKVTNPGKKRALRFFTEDGVPTADLVLLEDEVVDTSKPYTLFDPVHVYKRKTLKHYSVEPLLTPIYTDGVLVYELPALKEIRDRALKQVSMFPLEVRRLMNPHIYHVDLSQKLWDLKHSMITEMRASIQS